MASVERPGRRVDLDRLRLAACLSTFGYHAMQVFDLNPFYHVKSHTLSPSIDVASRLLHAVRMPLFFLIAGMVSLMALQRHSDETFMRQRRSRLLPPFFVGIIFLTPIVKYLELCDGRSIDWSGVIQHGVVVPEPLVFLRRYFTQPRWFSWSHMWFPLYLLLLTYALLPTLRAMVQRPPSGRVPASVALLVPLIGLVGIELGLRPIFPNHVPNLIGDWASIAVYALVLLAGAALIARPELERLVRRGLPLAAVVTILGGWLYIAHEHGIWLGIGRAVTLWGALGVAIGIGPWIARGRIAGEAYLAEAVLPIYVLHHVPLLVLATLVKDKPWPIWQRYGVIVIGAFAITVTLYHCLVRPFAIVRRAFGMQGREGRVATAAG